jgi:tetratricopeptide (TPR) repeat protein
VVRPAVTAVVLAALLASAVGLQAALVDRRPAVSPADREGFLYVSSPAAVRRAALSFDRLAADLYWIRVLQHYGGNRLLPEAERRYDLLWLLLDLTTSLDPDFDIAFRYGAVFLAEAFPSGPGRPDQAIALLEKGLELQPNEWRFAQDIGFVEYWWRQDYQAATDAFVRAAAMEGAPNWMGPLAAVTAAQGGSVAASRRLWQEVLANADIEWLEAQAVFRLRQLDAMDQMAALERVSLAYEAASGALPSSWDELIAAGRLSRVPVDPDGYPYQLNPFWGTATLHPDSSLNPLPTFGPALQ